MWMGIKIDVDHKLTIVSLQLTYGKEWSHRIKRLCFIVEINQYICWASVCIM